MYNCIIYIIYKYNICTLCIHETSTDLRMIACYHVFFFPYFWKHSKQAPMEALEAVGKEGLLLVNDKEPAIE